MGEFVKTTMRLGIAVLFVWLLAACSSSAAQPEPTNPDQAVQAVWETFTQKQKDEACAFYQEGRSTYGSSYIADRAEKMFPSFVNDDLYNAAYDMVDAKKYCE